MSRGITKNSIYDEKNIVDQNLKTNDVQNAEQRDSRPLTSPPRFTRRGGGGVPICKMQNYEYIGKDSV
jgi:hypothetical protein